MQELIFEIINNLPTECVYVTFQSEMLRTRIRCYSNLCNRSILQFAEVMNKAFACNNVSVYNIEAYIIEDELLFSRTVERLNLMDSVDTEVVERFNEKMVSTSVLKRSEDGNYYLMQCYEYFLYIFDKCNRRCYMIVKNNKKAITMVNILLLTPYLMYGDLFAVHGGLVNKGDRNVLISNSSLGGKTTFAILFASNGWNIITEETTYITRRGAILPYNIRNYFNIRLGTYLTFRDYFLEKNVVNEAFLKMADLDEDQWFAYGKQSQMALDFDILGTYLSNPHMYISHFLKVSINKNQQLDIQACLPKESVDSFMDLSLGPTVMLFEELLDFVICDQGQRRKDLEKIFNSTHNYLLHSGFDYKKQFKVIVEQVGL